MKVARVDELHIKLEHSRSERPLPQQSPQLSRHDPGTRSNCTVATLVKIVFCLARRLSLGPRFLICEAVMKDPARCVTSP